MKKKRARLSDIDVIINHKYICRSRERERERVRVDPEVATCKMQSLLSPQTIRNNNIPNNTKYKSSRETL